MSTTKRSRPNRCRSGLCTAPLAARLIYLTAAIVVMFAGLGSRKYAEYLPQFLARYAGDTLWALLLFLIVSVVFAGTSLVVRASLSLAIAFMIEMSQLYHAPWIDSVRQTTIGGLVLGFGFLWSDLICYSSGVLIGVIAEWSIGRLTRIRTVSSPDP